MLTLPNSVVMLFVPATVLLIVSVPSEATAAVVGVAPLLLFTNSLTAPRTLAISLLRCVLRLLRCKAGTAKNTTNMIKPAIARTIKTSIMVKPFRF